MSKLKPCPFCGGNATIIVDNKHHDDFQIIGCNTLSMLCPNPNMTAYKVDGEFDYTYWNRRVDK